MPPAPAIVDRRRGSGMSSYLPNDQRSPLDMNMQQQPGYGAVKAEPPSPIAIAALSVSAGSGRKMGCGFLPNDCFLVFRQSIGVLPTGIQV
jgi:hypothetical protein